MFSCESRSIYPKTCTGRLSIARDTSRTLSETVADLIRRGLGLPVVSLGKVITTDDVQSLEDDE